MDHPITIVTGAGSGIGRGVAELLANAGHRLVLVGRTESTLEDTMVHIGAHTAAEPEMMVMAVDVADAQQAMSVVDVAVERFGRVDVIVNNAGMAPVKPVDETDEDLLYRTFAVNTFGPGYLVARAWSGFRRQGSGCVVNVSSMATVDPFPGFFAYAASKAALESMTRSIAKEGAEFGIRAFAVAPGAVETGMLRSIVSEKDFPSEHTLDPLVVARTICDCVSGRCDATSGETIQLPNS